jgi:glycosyltransferase involved in cell wall biosynthesis
MVETKERLRIAMIGHKRVPSREGGIEIVVEELSQRMAALGHDVTCFNRRGHHVSGRQFDEKQAKRYKGIRIETVPTIDIRGLAAFSSSVFASLRAAFGPFDVVHFHAEGPCAMLWLPKLTGKRCVATIHGLDWQREKWRAGFGAKYIRFGEKVAAKHADEIIVLSRSMQVYFLQTYGRKTVFLPNGVARPEKLPANRIKREYGLSGRDYILFVGRLVPEKGLRYLITAYRKLDTPLPLVIAGGGSDSGGFVAELKAAADDNERILFTGFVQGKTLVELYSNAAIYVLPSDVEGMPLSLLEAMSFGDCCVVSDIPECAEVVGDHAVLFRKGSADDLAEKLRMLIDDPAAAERYRGEAAEYITSRYNWDDIVGETLRLYRPGSIGAGNHEDIAGQ